MFLLLFLQFFLKKQNFYSYQAFHILDFADYIPTVSVSILFCLLVLLFNCSVVSNSLQPHGLQHASIPCPSPSPWSLLKLMSIESWCHPSILSSVIPFSSCLQSFPASGSFQIFQFVVILTIKGFGVVNKAEVDVFLELFCFFYDPTAVDNLISGSFAFSKSSLNIWKLTRELGNYWPWHPAEQPWGFSCCLHFRNSG